MSNDQCRLFVHNFAFFFSVVNLYIKKLIYTNLNYTIIYVFLSSCVNKSL